MIDFAGPKPNLAKYLLITKDILGWVFGPNPLSRHVDENKRFNLRKAMM